MDNGVILPIERTVETMDVGPYPCNKTTEQAVHCLAPYGKAEE